MSKRASTSQLSSSTNKKAGLGTYFSISAPKTPSPLIASNPITDRQSTFVAHATSITTEHGAKQFHKWIRDSIMENHPSSADHEILGWRTMTLKAGKDGITGDENDWTVKTGGDDDEEKNGSNTIRKCLEEVGAIDVAVVISRYYGGIMLGPDRFTHMRNVTLQVLQRLTDHLALPVLLKQLKALDAEIDEFASPTKAPIYTGMTVEKAERLVKAREKRLEFLKAAKEKAELKEEEDRMRQEAEEEADEEERLAKEIEIQEKEQSEEIVEKGDKGLESQPGEGEDHD